jgi:hypothetical protein
MLIYLLLFFIVAAIYSSQGLGGLPSLIAILVFLPFTGYETKALALILSIVLVGYMILSSPIGSLGDMSDVIIILGCAIPAVIFGAKINLPQSVFFFAFGIMFVICALSILSKFKTNKRKPSHKGAMMIGSALTGFVVGVTGMVGSVFILPILFRYKWKSGEEISFFSSVFVLLTSVIALVASYKNGMSIDYVQVVSYSFAALLGSVVGRKIEISYLNTDVLNTLTGLFLLGSGCYFCYQNYLGLISYAESFVN